MRSFVALMACISGIAWIHSCEKRLLGVKSALVMESNQPELPVDISAGTLQNSAGSTIIQKKTVDIQANSPLLARYGKKEAVSYYPPLSKEPYTYNHLIVVKRPSSLMNFLIP
ncbi:hypothetical protein [Chitinophaga solisilvae]|uniref:hypothetical protein n=1 Tax=Chitinophaga solisilvae TaxID=1233460 RepID=UPI00136ADB8F|nr:hypothetical protein [Chitinophaga solisilvae]